MKSLGLVSVIALIASLIYAQIKWGPDYTKTFSRLIAQKRTSIIYYFIIFFTFLSLFSLFIITSFVPQLKLPSLFTMIYFLGVAAQLICISVPETGGYKTKVHLIAAGIMSTSAFAQVALLVFLLQLSPMSLVVCVASLSIMALIWLIVIINHRFIRYELILQSVYFASYLGTLLFVSYRI